VDGERVTTERLSRVERWLLAVPLAGGLFFGLFPFILPVQFATTFGYAGDDPFVARLAGAATSGYALALFLGIRDGRWAPLRAIVVATLTFNLVSLLASTIEIAADRATPVVYLIFFTDIAISLITWTILVRNGATPQGPRDVAQWVVILTVLGTIAAATFGIAPQFPKISGPLTGYHGTDEFLYREAGAATAGYALMGIWELRSLRWDELRLAHVMGLVFNGFAFIASITEILTGGLTVGTALIAPASGAFAVGIAIAIARKGH
jgi:hypothetical protein